MTATKTATETATETTVAASIATASTCTAHTGALDVDVVVGWRGRTLTGGVTLIPGYDGRYGAWGSPDHWVDPSLLVGLEELCDDDALSLADLLTEIEHAAAAECDAA